MIGRMTGLVLVGTSIFYIGSEIYKGIIEIQESVKSDYEKCLDKGSDFTFNEHTQECKYEPPCIIYNIKKEGKNKI